MAQITLTFPDGNQRSYAQGLTAAEVAAFIAPGLAKKAISASVNGTHFDLAWPITTDAKIEIHTMADTINESGPLDAIIHNMGVGYREPRRIQTDLELAHVTQVWLAEGDDATARSTGNYWCHQEPAPTHPAVDDPAFQEELLDTCARLTGVALPTSTQEDHSRLRPRHT